MTVKDGRKKEEAEEKKDGGGAESVDVRIREERKLLVLARPHIRIINNGAKRKSSSIPFDSDDQPN